MYMHIFLIIIARVYTFNGKKFDIQAILKVQ